MEGPTPPRFALNKITHHQTLMPEIFEYLSCKSVLQLLHTTSRGSRQLLLRNYHTLTQHRDDLRYLLDHSPKLSERHFSFSKSYFRLRHALMTESRHVIVGGGCHKVYVFAESLARSALQTVRLS